jgi:hypothetical protein
MFLVRVSKYQPLLKVIELILAERAEAFEGNFIIKC